MSVAVLCAALLLVQNGRGPAVDSIVASGITRGAFPGAALVIGRRDTILVARGYGRLTWAGSGAAVTADSTMYDLASVTNVIATTTAMIPRPDHASDPCA